MLATYLTHVILRNYQGAWQILHLKKYYQNDQIENNKIAWQVAYMNDMRNEYKFCQKLLKNGTTSKVCRRLKDDIKMEYQE
jgi:hypothetical protein